MNTISVIKNLLAGILLFFCLNAYAQNVPAPISTNVLDQVLGHYQNAASTWGNIMMSKASWLFWSLALLSMVWTYSIMALKKSDIQEFLAETVRFLVVTGFFWWILINGPAISNAIIDSMREIGAQAIGINTKLQPSKITDIGFKIFFKVLDNYSPFKPVDTAISEIMAIVILILLTIIGVNMLLLLVSGWILAYGGIFFLGFGGARWTSDIAINYYKTIIGLGAQFMAMTLIVGIGTSFIDIFYKNMGAGINLKEMSVLMVASLILLFLSNKVPPMFANIIGSGAGNTGIGNFGSGAFFGAAGMAMAAASTGGSMALSSATNIAGGASALKAAFETAQHNMSKGEGKFASSSSSLGSVGRFAQDMASTLSQTAGSTIKDNSNSFMNTVKENIGQTPGGKMAASIRENLQSNSSEHFKNPDQFEGNSVSGSDEVNDFINGAKKQ